MVHKKGMVKKYHYSVSFKHEAYLFAQNWRYHFAIAKSLTLFFQNYMTQINDGRYHKLTFSIFFKNVLTLFPIINFSLVKKFGLILLIFAQIAQASIAEVRLLFLERVTLRVFFQNHPFPVYHHVLWRIKDEGKI